MLSEVRWNFSSDVVMNKSFIKKKHFSRPVNCIKQFCVEQILKIKKREIRQMDIYHKKIYPRSFLIPMKFGTIHNISSYIIIIKYYKLLLLSKLIFYSLIFL